MLEQNEYFDLYAKGKSVYLRLKKEGYALKDFDAVTSRHPRIQLDSFPIIREALSVVGEERQIGTYLPEVELSVTKNQMRAEIVIHATEEIWKTERERIEKEVERLLNMRGITYGIQPIPPTYRVGESFTIAQGKEPQRGANAQITYIDQPDRTPIMREDGSANLYELNFVTSIEKDGWLGEKIPPQEGEVGYTIFGDEVPALRGEDRQLRYDRKTVYEVEEGPKIVLRAIKGGALEFNGGSVGVASQLVIQSDVGPETGSIEFDGSVVIHGTVRAGFSVVATSDISIEGSDSVANAEKIVSTEGDIYIRGGVFGAGETYIQAAGQIFVKHANNCSLEAEEIHVGAYLIGSQVIADRVYVDRYKGKIIGGTIRSLERIECAIAGNRHERTTRLFAHGIDKSALRQEMRECLEEKKEFEAQLAKVQPQLSKIEPLAANLNYSQKEALQALRDQVATLKQSIEKSNHRLVKIANDLKRQIKPKIEVTKNAHPGVVIQIGSKMTTLNKETNGEFELVGDMLNV